ncbi:autotransporter outer membrane beta-barrel domain-containing protein [Citrobacter braakii]|uniref:autotransporter outer membrane beta-barrel domain-containing protein n=1 Tax=Citrobacter TaxID=544 RepID=UPI000CD11393|nr:MULTISPECIES: autotransporter outer membrane beta-barrel domain-containing protein [Citrobacter]HCB1435241.1 autotransporter outer membrane beta-barrel domain-containing protein [Citrobacter braakii]AUV26726.1 autotransporter outer membrane beta-barrel domain-containing protein [Citrobacter freundii complex sp. CFNIH3]MBA7758180.1 autotransporter outer membrane beta-barrel domain-containing protein [Citrobacter sp. RHBSTW-00325]POV68063.1 autotransporter outer membrane beta-barrel domain-con
MNKVFNTVWNESTGMWVVTSELTRKGGRRPRQIKRTALAGLIAGLLLPSQPVLAADYDNLTLGKGGASSSMSLGAGDTATNTTINTSGMQYISSGGSATSTTINLGGQQNVSNGGVAMSTTINSAGIQQLFSGGTATYTTIEEQGKGYVHSGGIITDTSINSGGELYIYSGGSATDTTINSGGGMSVEGSANNTIIHDSGAMVVHSGGIATKSTIYSGGFQYVSSGGIATNTTLGSNGFQYVFIGGSATDTVINKDGRQFVSSGGSVTDITINSGGFQHVFSGGSATDTTINSGGGMTVEGSANNTIIHDSGGMVVHSGGIATKSTIYSGGFQYVSSGGIATNTTLGSDGFQHVFSGGSATDTVINKDGRQFVSSGGSATDTTINSGGSLLVHAGGSAVNITQNSGSIIKAGTSSVLNGNNTNGSFSIAGGSASNMLLENGGALTVYSGHQASDTTVGSNGTMKVHSGGYAIETTLTSGGMLQVEAGGSASQITQNEGGAVVTNTSAVLSGTNAKGSFSIAGGSAANMLLENGGYLTVFDGHQASDTTVGSNGTLEVHSGGVLYGTTTLTDKGTLVGDVVKNEGNLYFLNNSAATFAGTLTGTGTLTQEGGSTRFSGLLSKDGGIALQSGGAMTMDALQAKVNVTTQSGTTLTLDNGTILTGNVAGDSTGAGDMAIKGASVWHLDGDSTVGALTLDNGTVDFRPSTTTRLTPAFQAVSLTLGSLSGSGMFRMNTDIASHTGDMLKVAGNASGNFVLDIKNTGREPVSAGAPLQVVQTGGGDATFTLNGGKVDAGTWEYGLSKENTNWYLKVDTPPPVTPPTNPDAGNPDVGVPSPVYRTTKSADAVLGMATAPVYVFNSELQNLRFRHGDFMQNTRSPGGVWGRYTGSDNRISGGASSGYALTQNGFETGGDKVFDLGESRLAVGAFVSYTDNSISHNRGGDSTIGSTGGGLYATWFDNDGYYVDGVLKYNRFNNELRTWMSDGTAVKGDYSQNGFGGSLEAGKTFSLNDNTWAQPYVRTTAFRTDAKDISLNNGMKASIGTTKSLQAEAGVNLGMNLDIAGKTVKPYLKAAISHEFSDNNKVRINDSYDFRNDISGTTGKYGLGVSAQLTPNAGVWAEARYENGKHTESPVTGSVGFRFNF